MKRILATLLLLLHSVSIAKATDELLYMMVQGKYLLVGKALDSEETYHGKVQIKDIGGILRVERKINGKVIEGTAAIGPALNGEAKVLRIRFSDGKNNFEQTCLVRSDLDNYARISCYLYQPEIHTNNPGLEVLFNDHTAK